MGYLSHRQSLPNAETSGTTHTKDLEFLATVQKRRSKIFLELSWRRACVPHPCPYQCPSVVVLSGEESMPCYTTYSKEVSLGLLVCPVPLLLPLFLSILQGSLCRDLFHFSAPEAQSFQLLIQCCRLSGSSNCSPPKLAPDVFTHRGPLPPEIPCSHY